MTSFTLLRIIGPAPTLPAGLVFNAPRPLAGSEVTTDLMGFSVVVTADWYRREDAIENNRRMDARLVEWVSRDEALAEARAYVVAEYGEDTLADVGDDDLIDVWRNQFAVKQVDVEDVDR